MTWAWSSITGELGLLLNPRMKALDNDLALSSKVLPVQEKVFTTDATVTTLTTLAIPVSTTVVVSGYVAARRTGGSAGAAEDGAGYRVEIVAKNTAGTAAAIGSSVTAIGESQAGWDVTVDASGGSIRVRVTGAANNNVSWIWSGRTISVRS